MRCLHHIFLLTLLSLPLFFVNPTGLGLFTTQEAIRVNVAREMQRAGSWIVPLRHGEAYIAKPPMVYWCQMALASVRGAEVGELDGRLNAAIWGWLGVIATYLVARRLLAGSPEPSGDKSCHIGALWSALVLEAGVLYVHQSRVGEIDIMLVAPVVAAIGSVHASWSRYLRIGRAHWPALIFATFCATAATMIKGPPALMVIGLAGSGAAVLRAMISTGREPVQSVAGTTGILRPGSWWKQLESTHPVLVLGVPALVFWGWLRLVANRVGGDELARKIAFEADDNLRLLELGAWVRNAEAASYALGAFTVAAALGLWLLWRERRTMTSGRFLVLAWAVLGFVAFSVTTKGVSRYLTPVWPALAMAAGVAIEQWLARSRYAARTTLVLVGALVLQAVALGWWYGFGRAGSGIVGAGWRERSPRDFMAELLPKVERSRLGSLGFNFDAFDVYAGEPVEAWGDEKRLARPVAELVETVRTSASPYTLLVLEENDKNRREFGSASSILKGAGLEWEEIPVTARYARPPGDARVMAWRVRPAR